MKLQELLSSFAPEPDFARYGNHNRPHGMPSLDFDRLAIHPITDGDIRTPTEGDGTLVLSYKNKHAAIVSAAELADGVEWSILQVQGAASTKAYRIATCLHWQQCLAHQWKWFAEYPEAGVEVVSMPPIHQITNLTGSKNLEGAMDSYAAVRNALRMQRSDTEDKWIVDVTRREAAQVLAPETLRKAQEQ